MKNVVLGITGGIAAYKAAQLTSDLIKKGYSVDVIMTKNACEFITPLTLETLSKHRVSVDTFDRNHPIEVEHISLAKKADVFVIAPATANVIAKVANGLADDMLTTTFLAAKCPKILVPAMNTGMLENPITQDNLKKCMDYGMSIVESESGMLACGDVGKGRFPELSKIIDAIDNALVEEKYLSGKKVVVSAGPTQEAIDPVRFISNHSSGKMGYCLAREAVKLGAEVVLVHGKTALKCPDQVKEIPIVSAADMAEAVKSEAKDADVVIMSAAVADYTPVTTYDQKVKKKDDDMSIPLKRTEDILNALGKVKKNGQILIGFAMETENLINNASEKLAKKNADYIVANSLREEGAGFGTDTNHVIILSKDAQQDVALASKEEVARIIFDYCVRGK